MGYLSPTFILNREFQRGEASLPEPISLCEEQSDEAN